MRSSNTPSGIRRIAAEALQQLAQRSDRNVVRWLWMLALLFVVSLALTSLWAWTRGERAIEKHELESVRLTAKTLAGFVEREFETATTALVSIEQRQTFREAWTKRRLEDLKRHLDDALRLEPSFLFVSVFEPDGTLRIGQNAPRWQAPDPAIVGRNFAHRDWYRGVTSNWQPYVSGVFRAASPPSPMVVGVAAPIRDAQGKPSGILMATFTLEDIAQKFRALAADSGGTLFGVDQHGTLAASTDAQPLGEPLKLPTDVPIQEALAGRDGAARTGVGTNEIFAGYAPVSTTGWAVVYTRPAAEAMQLATFLRGLGLSAVAILSLIYLATSAIALNLVRKQGRLLAANRFLNETLEAARSDLEQRVQERTAELARVNDHLRAQIAEREAMQAALGESEKRYRTVVETATDAILNVDGESNILFANPAVVRVFGYTPEELVGRKLTLLMPEYLRHLHEAGIRRYQKTGKRHINWEGIELPGLHKLGHEIPLEVSFGEFLKDGRPMFTGFVRDISERKRVEAALRDSEQQYRLLFQGNPHPMWIFDRETLAFLAVNDAAVHHYGFSREEFLAMTIKDIRPPEEIPALLTDVHAGHIGHDPAGIWKHVRKDGSPIEVDISSHELVWTGRPAKLVLAMDVTERRQLEKQLLQAQKMEAVGHLAGGVAHDFNNLLGVIIGYCEILLTTAQLDDQERERVEEIKKAGDHAATLTRQLLAFSRQQIVEPRVLDLNAVLQDMSKLLRRLIGEDIEMVTVLKPGLGMIKADPGQMEQVVMNLAVNARDAMPRGGKLIIETANITLDEEYARKHVAAKPGAHVMLAVTDTGIGMDEATQSRIFEPFFTTKEQGRGTGLGLATVYGIVKQSGGNIWVYSELGRGTTFKIYLPLVREAADSDRVKERAAFRGGTETILVVEDAEPMRRLTCEFLSSLGYQVREAADGLEALRLADGPGPAIDMLLTDVVLPKMSGRELAQQLVSRIPHLKLMFMSGYTDDTVLRNGIVDAKAAFIQKPFTLANLAARVRQALDAGFDPGRSGGFAPPAPE